VVIVVMVCAQMVLVVVVVVCAQMVMPVGVVVVMVMLVVVSPGPLCSSPGLVNSDRVYELIAACVSTASDKHCQRCKR
jgi:hypothetical protein